MKFNFLKLSLLFFLAVTAGCEGPQGPPGPEGQAGPQGVPGPEGLSQEGLVFEYDNVDFQAPDYWVYLKFPDYEAFTSDAVLVYYLFDTDTDVATGELIEIWRLLPQSSFTQHGELVYNYQHTFLDAEVFLEADFDIAAANLGPEYLNDWVIRVVILPAAYGANSRGGIKLNDFSDYQKVKKLYNLPDDPKVISLK